MAPENHISHSVHISNEGILVDGEIKYRSEGQRGAELLVDAYKALGINYPKFYKMDNLSKLAVLAAELLLSDAGLREKYKAQDIAVIVSNANSSIDTDRRYWETVKAGAPSPSLFVYTLPNVMLGEICIRWGIKGENTCLVSEQFDAAFQTDYVNSLLDLHNAEVIISGWADYLDGEMEAFFMLVEKNHTSLDIHNPLTVQKLYDRQWKN
jgi:3-oxoacyl-(acyl-carrier-protein) synthase